MIESRFRAPASSSRPSRVWLVLAIAAFLVVAACEPVASPASTGAAASSATAPPSTAAPQASVALVAPAPAPTPVPVRPPGVPANAQPLMFGCKDGVARCTDIAAGTYYTAGEWALLPGLTFTLPAGWSSLANEAGELELHRNGDDHNELMFWRDVVPWVDGRPDLEATADPEGWIARLRENPCVEVSDPERVNLGDWIDLRAGGTQLDLEAISVTVDIAAEAAYERAGCPDTGQVVIMSDPMHWESGFAVGGDEMNDPSCPCKAVQRMTFASIGYASHKHLLVAVLQSYEPTGEVDAAMASLQAAAQPILDSLIAPAIVVDN
jgi:hypothetical protein